MIMIRKGEPPRKQTTPLGNNTKKPKNVVITESKSSNNYESIKEKVSNDAGMRKLI
jgi:hypothetical protein